MANNECSGPALSAALIRHVAAMPKRRYTYRFVFAPETIGAITYLATEDRLNTLKAHVVAAFNLTCVGDDRHYSMVESRYGDTLADRVLKNIFRSVPEDGGDQAIHSFLRRGSDERQYCSPGVDLPMATFCRSKFHDYPEYHTSADDMSFVSPHGFQGSFDVMTGVIDALENNAVYTVKMPCEPQLGKRGLYPTTSQKGTKGDAAVLQDFLAYADGKNDLIGISDIIGCPVSKLIPMAETLEKNGIITRCRA